MDYFNTKLWSEKMTRTLFLVMFVCTITLLSCAQDKAKKVSSPMGYDLSNPVKYNMPEVLQEISGFAFLNGNPANVYAQQDEEGKVFMLSLGDKKHTHTKFSKNGDYEDMAIAKGRVIVLKSNGDLYSFPLEETKNKKTDQTVETKSALPKGEYESLYADPTSAHIYLLCKECKQDKGSGKSTGEILKMQEDGSFEPIGKFAVNATAIDKLTGKKKGAFRPSAFSKHPITGEWYIVSAINKVLVVADSVWNIKSAHHLSSNQFSQPEGIAFDSKGNMYISNEGSDTQYGNILKFDYHVSKR